MTFYICKTYTQTRKEVIEKLECVDEHAFRFTLLHWNSMFSDIFFCKEVRADGSIQ
jgi:hypothetical protein